MSRSKSLESGRSSSVSGRLFVFAFWFDVYSTHARVTHVFWSNVSGVASDTASARAVRGREGRASTTPLHLVARTAVRALFTFNTLTHDHRVHTLRHTCLSLLSPL